MTMFSTMTTGEGNMMFSLPLVTTCMPGARLPEVTAIQSSISSPVVTGMGMAIRLPSSCPGVTMQM